MPENNYYFKAVTREDPTERLQAFHDFAQEELEESHQRLKDAEQPDGSVRDAAREQWNYEKGRMDTHRLYLGLFAQGLMQTDVDEDE